MNTNKKENKILNHDIYLQILPTTKIYR